MDKEITYKKPPVREVVLGVQFPRLKGFMAYQLGALRDAFAEEYPGVEERPPLDPSFEVFGVNPARHGLQLSQLTDFVPRVWFKSADDAFLVQFQPDRLVCNWRRIKSEPEYPRYEALRRRFESAYKKVSSVLESRALPAIAPNQCEITYLNHLQVSDADDWWAQPGKAIGLLGDFQSTAGEKPEDARFQIRYVLNNKESNPNARLIISGEPLVSPQGQKVLGLNLSVKGHPVEAELASVMTFFDTGHACIVQKFDAIATPYAQKLWERVS
jgi:uncharacterized protein (TIGR04255 family)